MVQKFDPFLPIDFITSDDFQKKENRDSVGSINSEIIVNIKGLRCTNKCNDEEGGKRGKLLISEEESPMTGYCGHLFCHGCAFDLYIEQQPTSNENPRATKAAMFEVEGTTGKKLYRCKSCVKTISPDINEVNCIVRAFSENIMLRDLYTALKVGFGFRCAFTNCDEKNKIHPKFNSLHCLTCSTENKKMFFCVWHSGKHRKQNPKHDLRIINQLTVNSYPDTPARGLTLSSLDRTQRKVVAALYHCACCSTSLEKDARRGFSHRHLECGHFVGGKCLQNARNKILNRMKALHDLNDVRDKEKEWDENEDDKELPEGLYCNFCRKDSVKKPALGVRPVFPPIPDSKLKDSVKYDWLIVCNEDCKECNFTACQTMYSSDKERPTTDDPVGRCKCCRIEHLLRENCTLNIEKKKKKKK